MIYQVRRANSLTWRTVRHLCLELTNSGDRGDCRDDGVDAGSSMRSALKARLSGMRFNPATKVILARTRPGLVGLAAWCLLEPEAPDFDRAEARFRRDHGELAYEVGFYVSPEFRKQGVGRELVRVARDVAVQQGMSRLAARPWNRSSMRFFRSCGFSTLQDYGPRQEGYAVLNVNADPAAIAV